MFVLTLMMFKDLIQVNDPYLPQHIKTTQLLKHLETFNQIAYAHENKSRSISNAYPQSAEYVMKKLKETTCDLSGTFYFYHSSILCCT